MGDFRELPLTLDSVKISTILIQKLKRRLNIPSSHTLQVSPCPKAVHAVGVDQGSPVLDDTEKDRASDTFEVGDLSDHGNAGLGLRPVAFVRSHQVV